MDGDGFMMMDGGGPLPLLLPLLLNHNDYHLLRVGILIQGLTSSRIRLLHKFSNPAAQKTAARLGWSMCSPRSNNRPPLKCQAFAWPVRIDGPSTLAASSSA